MAASKERTITGALRGERDTITAAQPKQRNHSNTKATIRKNLLSTVIDRPPSEYFPGRCFLTTEPGEAMVPYVFERISPEIVCYSSDYCHWDCDFPDSVKLLEERTDLDVSFKDPLFSRNAAKLYDLPLPEGS